MISGRAILTVGIVAVLVWLGFLAVRADFQPAGLCHDLGITVGKAGLRGIGAALLEASVSVRRNKLAAAEKAKAPAEELAKQRREALNAEIDVARFYLRSGKPLKAKECIEAARKKDYNNPALLLLLSEARMELGEQENAKLGLLRVFARDKKNARAAHLLGEIFEAESKPDDAISYFRRAVDAEPDNVSARLALAQALTTKGSADEAKKHASAAVAAATSVGEKVSALKAAGRIGAPAESPSTAVINVVVKRYWKHGLVAVALISFLFAPLLLTAVSRMTRVPAAYAYLLLSRRDRRALGLYRQLLQRRPGNVAALRILAQEEARNNPLSEQAMQLCERWYDGCPQDAGATTMFARVALLQERSDEKTAQACQAWYDMGIADPGDLQRAASFLCEAYLNAGAMDERAIPVCEVVVAEQPDRHELVRYLGALYNEFGRDDNALQALSRSVELDPEDLESRRLLAAACIASGEYYRAYRHLYSLPSTDEVDSAMYVAAVGCEQSAKASAALRIFKEVARREPGFADVQQRIQRLSPVADKAACGEYALQFVIGESPAYKVCAARRGDTQYTMCVFRRDCSDAVSFPEVFVRDVALLEALEHEALPRALEHGEADEEYYVATEPVVGKAVRALLEERGKLSLKESAVIVGEVLRALAHLHGSGIVHGDVSPDNVLVDTEGQVKLLATGLTLVAAKAIGQERAAHLHCAECVAPEIVQKHPVASASDIYAAGALLYHMLVGEPPFTGGSHLAVMMAHVASEPKVPSELDESLFADVDTVVMRALQKNPDGRYESAAGFRTALLAAGGLRDDARAVTLGVVGRSDAPDAGGDWWGHFHNVNLTRLAWGAKVYRAVRRRENRVSAVKELAIARAVDTSADGRVTADAQRACQRLFQNEIHLLQHITEQAPHKGIVAVYEAWAPKGGHTGAYCMELLNASLADRLTEGPLAEQEATDIIAAVCAAVGHLHEQGIAHRHLSPSAVMFDAEGAVRLVGFDHACRLQDAKAVLATEAAIQAASPVPAEALGHAAYSAPEQCRAEDFDRRLDVYSIGCLLFALLVGHPPFCADDPVALMLKHLSESPPPLEALGVQARPAVQTFLDRALAKDPADRFPDANEALEALMRQSRVSAAVEEGAPVRYRIQV